MDDELITVRLDDTLREAVAEAIGRTVEVDQTVRHRLADDIIATLRDRRA